MWRYFLVRFAMLVPTVLAVVTFVFLAMRLVPGDPAVIIAGDYADAATIAKLRHEWGLDRPLPVQYWEYVKHLATGQLGTSITSQQPVTFEIRRRIGITLQLAAYSIVIAIVIGVLAGILSSLRPYTWLDYGSTVFALLGISTPIFWSGLLLIILFSLVLHWLPTGGVGGWRHFVMPSVSLGIFAAGVIARQTRSSMLETLEQDYIRTARSKGLRERRVILMHALRASLIPIVTITGLQFGRMLAGAILVETVFDLPGLGSYLVLAIGQRNYPVIQAIVLVFAFGFTLVNLAVDMTYPLLNPTVSHR